MGYGGSAAPYAGATSGKHTAAEVGGEARFHFFPSGTRGVAITADVAAGSASGVYGRGALGGGFAVVPAPFDSPWGYEVTAQVGLGKWTTLARRSAERSAR